MLRSAIAITIVLGFSAVTSPPPPADLTWPGFRGHGMTGVAPGTKVPERWSPAENVTWKVEIPGQGWSSPIVWGDTVFITSGISGKATRGTYARGT